MQWCFDQNPTSSYVMDHRDWPGKRWRAECQACHCTRLAARSFANSQAFLKAYFIFILFLNVSFHFQNSTLLCWQNRIFVWHVVFSQNCCFVANFVDKVIVDDSTSNYISIPWKINFMCWIKKYIFTSIVLICVELDLQLDILGFRFIDLWSNFEVCFSVQETDIKRSSKHYYYYYYYYELLLRLPDYHLFIIPFVFAREMLQAMWNSECTHCNKKVGFVPKCGCCTRLYIHANETPKNFQTIIFLTCTPAHLPPPK